MGSTVSTALSTTVIVIINVLPLTYTLGHYISMVKKLIPMRRVYLPIHAFFIITLVFCTDDATLKPLAREKGFAVKDVPRDVNCHQALCRCLKINVIWREKQMVEADSSHFCQALSVSSQHFLSNVSEEQCSPHWWPTWLCHQNRVPSKSISTCSHHPFHGSRTHPSWTSTLMKLHIGDLLDYAIRIEFQARVSPHAHTILSMDQGHTQVERRHWWSWARSTSLQSPNTQTFSHMQETINCLSYNYVVHGVHHGVHVCALQSSSYLSLLCAWGTPCTPCRIRQDEEKLFDPYWFATLASPSTLL